MLGNVSCFCCCLLSFLKKFFFQKKKTFSKIIRVSNSLDLDQDLHSVRKGYQQNTKVAAQVDSKHFLECFDLTHITILIPRTILSLIVFGSWSKYFMEKSP